MIGGKPFAPPAGQRQRAFAQDRECIGGEFRFQGLPAPVGHCILALRMHRIVPDQSRGSAEEFTNCVFSARR